MKSLLKTVITLIILAGNFSIILAQDTIFKRDNERIICKVKEISTDEIKYLLLNNGNEILLGIDKNDVSKVILSNGTVMNFSHSMNGLENYKDQNKNCIKVRFFTPLYGFTEISFEHSFKPGSSIEGTLGIIGFGKHYDYDPKGISLKFGYKLIQNPDFYLKGMRYAHILKGFYLRPEIAVSFYQRNDTWIDFNFTSNNIRKDYFAAALLFNIGKQWIFSDFMALDLFFGVGYGYSSDDSFEVRYGFTTGAKGFPIALSSGFRLGILF